MEPIWTWGLEFIATVQSIGSPPLDLFFRAITFLGEEDFFMALLPLLLWCVDYTLGMRLGMLILASFCTNVSLKRIFRHPRPFVLDPGVKRYETTGYGLPSGHAQAAVSVWGAVAAEIRQRWAWVGAVVLMILIGFSRVYLGVHFPTDVLAGWAVGVVVLLLYLRLRRPVADWVRRSDLGPKLALILGLPLVLVVLSPDEVTTAAMGVFLGVSLGALWLDRLGGFDAGGTVWQRFFRFVSGLVVLFGLRFLLKSILPGAEGWLYAVLRFLRYAVLGLWIGLGAPWAFRGVGLAPKPGVENE